MLLLFCIGSLSIMADLNFHMLLMIALMAFGSGHALVKARFGRVMFSLTIIFFLLIYFQIRGNVWSLTALFMFSFGILYATRDKQGFSLPSFRFGDELREKLSSLSNLIPRWSLKAKNGEDDSQSSTQSHSTGTSEEELEAERKRREQEAKAYRQKQKQKKGQGEQSSQPKKEYQSKQQYRSKKRSYKKKTSHHQQRSQKRSQKNSSYQKQQPKQEQITQQVPFSDTRSHREILGLDVGFSQDELKKAFKRESARCHPDKWAGKPEHLREAMEEEQKLINKAYQALKET